MDALNGAGEVLDYSALDYCGKGLEGKGQTREIPCPGRAAMLQRP
jgi:hypothetical protein